MIDDLRLMIEKAGGKPRFGPRPGFLGKSCARRVPGWYNGCMCVKELYEQNS